jgi:Glucose / Sorbosone dehydrogenase
MLLMSRSPVLVTLLLALLLPVRNTLADEEEVAKPKYKLGVQLLARHLGNPIDLFSIPGDTSGKRFILEQDGRVLTMDADNSVNRLVPFMNIQERVVSLRYAFDERGMIGVAFHPKFNENRKLYARYTGNRTKENICYDASGQIPTDPYGCPDQHSSILSEFTVFAENPDVVDPDSERVLMRVENPSGKNIGAGLAFGPGELIDRA